jgi:YD repeat-containing protein
MSRQYTTSNQGRHSSLSSGMDGCGTGWRLHRRNFGCSNCDDLELGLASRFVIPLGNRANRFSAMRCNWTCLGWSYPVSYILPQSVIEVSAIRSAARRVSPSTPGASNSRVHHVLVQNEYDDFGQLIETTDALGRQTHFDYDANGNMIESWTVEQASPPTSPIRLSKPHNLRSLRPRDRHVVRRYAGIERSNSVGNRE